METFSSLNMKLVYNNRFIVCEQRDNLDMSSVEFDHVGTAAEIPLRPSFIPPDAAALRSSIVHLMNPLETFAARRICAMLKVTGKAIY